MIKICLKTCAKQSKPNKYAFVLDTRLPAWIESPVALTSELEVQSIDNYYRIRLHITGVIPITCQRCLETFEYAYHQDSELVACKNEDVAEQLMSRYETVVAESLELDLCDLVIDELYFSSPCKHLELGDCN